MKSQWWDFLAREAKPPGKLRCVIVKSKTESGTMLENTLSLNTRKAKVRNKIYWNPIDNENFPIIICLSGNATWVFVITWLPYRSFNFKLLKKWFFFYLFLSYLISLQFKREAPFVEVKLLVFQNPYEIPP